MDWSALRIFLAIARAGRLRRAAAALDVSHATVARALANLERDLGARLFDRGRAGFVLTEPGERLLSVAERVEREIAIAEDAVLGRDAEPSGVVRLTAAPIFCLSLLPDLLPRFAEAFPEIDLRVEVTNRRRDLGRLEADVSIRIARQVEDDVVGRRLLQYRKAIYAAPAYLAAHPDLAVGDGAGAAWIGWEGPDDDAAWVRASPFPNAAHRHGLNEATLQVEAAARGLGLAYLPCFIGDRDPRLARVPGVPPVDDRSIWLLLHADLRRAARVRAVVDFFAERILADRSLFRGEAL